jgi:hypothetical protein
MVILRDPDPNPDEIWCRCDGGPHGFLSIAGHAHADALSIEVRIGGVEVLADPGTYCYHTDPRWRTYFRSTRGHNTLELAGEDQSVAGGPFNWTRHAAGTTVSVSGAGRGLRGEWVGEHDGYSRLDPPAIHRRRVILDRKARRLTVEDRIVCDGIHPCRLSFHLGPDIECRLDGTAAALEWKVGGSVRRAWLHLPGSLRWERVRGREDPPAGWYSPGLGVKVPAVTLVGAGEVGADSLLVTTMGLVEGSGEGPGTPMDSEADAPPIED